MIFVLVAAVGVLVVAVAHLAAGWIISNRLDRGLLTVQSRAKDLGVRVRAVTTGQIVLEAPTPRQDIGHPGTLGLVWPEGHGRVGDVMDVRDSRFIRSFEPVEGTPPLCTGELEDCPPVEVDPWVFQTGPGDVGLRYDTTTYRSPVGEMSAWLIPAGDSHRWAIHCHGWTAERRELVRMLPAYAESGLTSLVIDYRNDPGAPPDPTGRYRFGLTEWEDLQGAVELAISSGAEQIVLSGCSTGGAIVLAFLERSPLADRVSAVVLDSPNLILADAVRHGSRDSRPTPLMIEFGMWVADLRWKIDWNATNFVQRAEQILLVPTLVFHGTSDQTIPISVSRQLEAKVPGIVELVETPAAGHVMSWNADPVRYHGYLSRFLDRL